MVQTKRNFIRTAALSRVLSLLFVFFFLASTDCTAERSEFKTYHKFGFSFKYPAKMSVQEKPYLSAEVSEDSGELKLISDEPPFVRLDIIWVSPPPDREKFSQKSLEEFLGQFVDASKPIYRSELATANYGEHTVTEQRYVIIAKFGFVSSISVWWCNKSNRIFIIRTTRPSRGIIEAFPGMTAEDIKLPPKHRDPTYQDLSAVLKSFNCHVPEEKTQQAVKQQELGAWRIENPKARIVEAVKYYKIPRGTVKAEAKKGEVLVEVTAEVRAPDPSNRKLPIKEIALVGQSIGKEWKVSSYLVSHKNCSTYFRPDALVSGKMWFESGEDKLYLRREKKGAPAILEFPERPFPLCFVFVAPEGVVSSMTFHLGESSFDIGLEVE